jgi:glycosyltransferase involved in cell wall biosynthesis
MKVLYFSSIDWNFLWQRPQQILTRLVSLFNYNIELIQPFGLRNPSFLDIKRIQSRATPLLGGASVSDHGVKLRNLFFVPLVFEWLKPLNLILLRNQLKPLIDSETVIWATAPSGLIPDLVSSFDYGCLVYEMMDDYGRIHAERQEQILKSEIWLINNAALVIATSQALYDKAKDINKNQNVELIPNGVDYDFFQRAEAESGKKAEKGRTVGYVGAIDRWMDLETIEYIAEERKDLSIVLVGPIRVKKYPKRINIEYVGPVGYSRIPYFCNSFDACLLPFKPGEFADTINPIKLYEYFALGKPVIAYKMRELSQHGKLLYIGGDKHDFLQKLEEALSENGLRISGLRKQVARQNDWTDRAIKINEVINKIFEVDYLRSEQS